MPHAVSRRKFIASCTLGAVALAAHPLLGGMASIPGKNSTTGPVRYMYSLDQGWLFGGACTPAALRPEFNDGSYAAITLPHCVTKLSWQNWNASEWQKTWIYRRHFDLPVEGRGRRIILVFDGVMVGTTPVINGHALQKHEGGYLPSRYEITDWVKEKNNVLAVEVDSRWSNVPPQGAAVGAKRIDYLEPGGIVRSVHLQILPPVFIGTVFAKPVRVLEADRRVDVACTIDASVVPGKPAELYAELRDGDTVVATTRQKILLGSGQTEKNLTLRNLGAVKLWDVDSPHMYRVTVGLVIDEEPVHSHEVRIGFREAHFTPEGFYLNGRRLRLFGLNRHELYPFVGFAMPERVMRRDAEILRREFNCNVVRCSHYPQSEAFLDACDEIGLLVWDEIPGWGYIGDEPWKDLLVRDVNDMIVRDRNHPSIIIWGTRVNESPNDEGLYKRTRAVAKSLDDSRPTSGSMTSGSIKTWETDWHEDVFAYDDYDAESDGVVGIRAPLPGVPYFLAEAVGQYNYNHPKEGFNSKYRRAGDVELQRNQAVYHAHAHNKAASFARTAGVIAWCAFDYASLVNPYNNLKCPGVADGFRIPKLGASFYQTQIDPNLRPMIVPNFFWDFGAATPRGPGRNSVIFSNCERLDVLVGGKLYATFHPDTAGFPNLRYPPFVADLDMDGTQRPELQINGYVGGAMVLSRSFSSDPSHDVFYVKTDDAELSGDGADATRLEFGVADKFGTPRLYAGGSVTFTITGPGEIVGDNPFQLKESGGVGAVWLKTKSGTSGTIIVEAMHSALGAKSAAIAVTPENRSGKI